MSIENNTKYIAEAWVNNGEEEEFKKSYLASLIEQCQGHGNEFDADTVDGKHLEEILAIINDEMGKYIVPFRIGDANIGDNENVLDYYLGFEGIRLFIESADVEEEKRRLPWSIEPERTPPDLHEVIRELYRRTYLGDDEGVSTNKEIYTAFKNFVCEGETSLNSRVQGLEEGLDGRIINGYLNADSVNGISFFIYSRGQYDDLEELALAYDNGTDTSQDAKKASEMIHSIHNVFIIKDEEEIINAGYENGIYTGNLDVTVLDKKYQFRVANGIVINKNTGLEEEKLTLQYKLENPDLSETEGWTVICAAEDFIDKEFIEQYILSTLNSNTNYSLSPEVVKRALKNITVRDEDYLDIPLINYIKSKYLRGAAYNHKTDPTESYDYLDDKITKDGLEYLDLTPLQETIEEEMNLNKEEINTQINSINNSIGQINTNVTGVTSRVSSLETKHNSLQTQVNGIKTHTHSFGKSSADHITSYADASTKIAFVKIDVNFKHNGKKAGEWEYVGVYSKYQPQMHVIASTYHPEIIAKIETDGKVYARSESTTSKTNYIIANFTYPYK